MQMMHRTRRRRGELRIAEMREKPRIATDFMTLRLRRACDFQKNPSIPHNMPSHV